MKELLTKMLDELKAATDADLESLVDADFYITPDENVIPNDATFPLVALKDGDVERERIAHNAENHILNVEVIIYQLIKPGDDAFTAADPSTYSLLDLCEDVRTVLLDRTDDRHKLGIDGMLDNYSPDSSASDLMGAEDLAIQRRIVSFWYLKRVYI